MKKIIIAGSRTFNDYEKLKFYCDRVFTEHIKNVEIVHGGAKGADSLGDRYAKERGFKIKVFLPDWDTHGKKAGYLRNEQMAEYARGLIAFWDGESKGTKHMIDLAKEHNLPTLIIKI